VGIRTSERFVTVVHTASFILSWVLEQVRDLSLCFILLVLFFVKTSVNSIPLV
jgi:hypothetical protein